MGQAKFSFREKQAQFVSRYKLYGYKDKSTLVRAALDHFEEEMEEEIISIMKSRTMVYLEPEQGYFRKTRPLSGAGHPS